MAVIETIEIKSWNNLVKTIDNYFTHWDSYIFRGQADATWKLEPTLTRALKQTYPNLENTDIAINEHILQFKKMIRGRISVDLDKMSVNELWALGQHFGLYTPLLDWSRSPYISIFFSFLGKCNSGNRILWAVVESDIDRFNESKPNDEKIELFEPLTHYNNRLISQQGLFSNIPHDVDFEKWIRDSEKLNWITMYKFIYPDSIIQDGLAALNKRNINHYSLFPDISGSSLHSNYLFDIEPYLEMKRTEEENSNK